MLFLSLYVLWYWFFYQSLLDFSDYAVLMVNMFCPTLICSLLQLGFMLLALIWKFDFSPFMVLIIAILNDGKGVLIVSARTTKFRNHFSMH